MQLFDFPRQKYYLMIDRTHWRWGKIDINILTLGVVYKGSAIPVYWLVLNKQGNSTQRERVARMKRFLSQFGRGDIQGIFSDREFIGEQWWGWLKQQRIPYVMRFRENQLMLDHKGEQREVRVPFRDLKHGEHRQWRKTCQISGQWVWLSAMRLSKSDLLLLASNRRYPDSFAVYHLRWEIENLFQSLKGQKFHWEDTRITKVPAYQENHGVTSDYFQLGAQGGRVEKCFCQTLANQQTGQT